MNWFKVFKYAISKKEFNALSEWMQENEQRSFKDLFGDKDRIVIPYHSDSANNIKELMEQLGYKVDLNQNLAYKLVKTQQGDKWRPEKLGRALQKEVQNGKIEPSIYEDYSKKGDSGYSIVLSRRPIDVLRMSDFENIQSCHSEGGDYFQCARAESRGHGAIAYLVNNKDLSKVDLNAPELFEDEQRGIKGITPSARLRLRKYINNNDKYELAVPEVREYGNNRPNYTNRTFLYDSVRDYVFDKQKHLFNGRRPRIKEFSRDGGTYQDSNGGRLFNEFFKDEEDSNGDNAKYIGVDEAKNQADQYEEEARRIENRYRNTLEHYSVSYTVDESEGQVYLSHSAYGTFSYPKDIFKDGVFTKMGYQEEKKFTEYLRQFYNNCYIQMDVDQRVGYVNFNLLFEREQDGHPDDLSNTYSEFEDFDKEYDDVYEQFKNFMYQNGLIEDSEYQKAVNSKPIFQHFDTDVEKGFIRAESKDDPVFQILSDEIKNEFLASGRDRNSSESTYNGIGSNLNPVYFLETYVPSQRIFKLLNDYLTKLYVNDTQQYFAFHEHKNLATEEIIEPVIGSYSNKLMLKMNFNIYSQAGDDFALNTINYLKQVDQYIPQIMDAFRREVNKDLERYIKAGGNQRRISPQELQSHEDFQKLSPEEKQKTFRSVSGTNV